MIKSKELIDPTSCLNKAEEDEPIFVLRAHDLTAPSIVRAWASEYALRKDDHLNDREEARFYEAENLANQMEEWKQRQ